jgi:hypothetical protein
MTIYNVHIYREMRLVYGGIEAHSHEAAAAIARDKPTDQADSIDDCEGQTIAALVDMAGDEEYEQTRLIEFEEERLRKAAQKLLTAAEAALGRMAEVYRDTFDSRMDNDPLVIQLRAAIAEAQAAGVLREPAAPAVRNPD